MYRLLLGVLLVGLVSCKGKDVNNSSQQPAPVPQVTNTPTNQVNLPDPASFVSTEEIEKMFGLSAGGIYDVKPNNNPQNASRNVFYLISDPDLGNAGMLIAAYGNPIPDEMDDPSYAFWRIDALKSQGTGDPSEADKFEKYDDWDMGLDGAYSKESSRYFWRDSNNVIYMIAFNVTQSKDLQFEIANKVAKKITPETPESYDRR